MASVHELSKQEIGDQRLTLGGEVLRLSNTQTTLTLHASRPTQTFTVNGQRRTPPTSHRTDFFRSLHHQPSLTSVTAILHSLSLLCTSCLQFDTSRRRRASTLVSIGLHRRPINNRSTNLRQKDKLGTTSEINIRTIQQVFQSEQ